MSASSMDDDDSGVAWAWLAAHGRATFESWDLFVGGLAAAVVVVAAGFNGDVRSNGVTILIAESALGLALMSVVLGTLGLLVSFIDERYRQVIALTPGGIGAAWQPYKTVAFLGGMAALVGLLAAVLWETMNNWGQATLLGCASGLLIWAIGGTIQIVFLTAWHGQQRARLMQVLSEARRTLEERRRSVGSG